jgi:DnaJ-class molecular chaperone
MAEIQVRVRVECEDCDATGRVERKMLPPNATLPGGRTAEDPCGTCDGTGYLAGWLTVSNLSENNVGLILPE